MLDKIEYLKSQLVELDRMVQELTGLDSRWNGEVRLTDTVDIYGAPAFSARKDWDCGISVHIATLNSATISITLLHECVHSVSVGLTPASYARFRGLEEGVVERVTQMFLPQIAQVSGGNPLLLERRAYEHEGILLDELRVAAQMDAEPFYLELLRIPLAERESTVVKWIEQAHPLTPRPRILASCARILRELR